jgi:putative transcriptional regulator
MIERSDIDTRFKDSYHALMLGYASGTLDQAQTLITALHIALSKKAQRLLRDYECLGASFLEKECEPVSLCKSALDNVLAQIEEKTSSTKPTPNDTRTRRTVCDTMCVEEIIKYAIGECQNLDTSSMRWKRAYPGFQILELDLSCKNSSAKFMKVDPAKKTPKHSHTGLEITLILDGSYSDETGHYSKGDLIVTDEHCEHAPKSCPDNGCVCMIVSSSPIRLSGISKLLNPFIRF